MAYSDKDLQVATQIAYYDLSVAFKDYRIRHTDFPTLKVLLTSDKSIREGIDDQLRKAEAEKNAIDITRFTKQQELYNEIASGKLVRRVEY